MKISRRTFLKGSLTTLFLAGTGLPVYSSNKAKKNLFKSLYQKGIYNNQDRFFFEEIKILALNVKKLNIEIC